MPISKQEVNPDSYDAAADDRTYCLIGMGSVQRAGRYGISLRSFSRTSKTVSVRYLKVFARVVSMTWRPFTPGFSYRPMNTAAALVFPTL